MLKSILVVVTTLFASWMLVGSTTAASANYRHGGCCGPVRPTYVYHAAHKVTHVTRYRDVSRTRYVYRTHRIVHVTRVRPVVYVHAVTRVHHHTVGVVRPVYEHYTQVLPARVIMTHSVINTYDCRCAPYHHSCR